MAAERPLLVLLSVFPFLSIFVHQSETMSQTPLKIDVKQVIAAKSPSLAKKLPRFVINRIKKLVHQDEINEILALYADYEGVEFATHALAHLGITYTPHGMDKIDPSGRYIFVSNHPLGGLDLSLIHI